MSFAECASYAHRTLPKTPAKVRDCPKLASEAAINVEHDRAPMIVIMPSREYARIVVLDAARPFPTLERPAGTRAPRYPAISVQTPTGAANI